LNIEFKIPLSNKIPSFSSFSIGSFVFVGMIPLNGAYHYLTHMAMFIKIPWTTSVNILRMVG